MTEFLLFCIATVGMTSIITQGVIFQPFRQFIGNWAEKAINRREQKAQATGKLPRRQLIEWFNELINCAQCTGFWCGLFCGLYFLSGRHLLEGNHLLTWLCYGFGGSFLSALGCNVIDWVFYRKMNALRQLEEQDLMLAARRENPTEHQE
jgi:hypothetical protein